MKAKKILKSILIIAVVVLISMISFAGVYVQHLNRMENVLPEYLLATDLQGGRMIHLKVDDTTEEKTYDKDGNLVENQTDSTENEEGLTKVQEPVNQPEALTEENFKTCKMIIEKRLKKLGFTDYQIRQASNGDIFLVLPEDDTTDRALAYLYNIGKFEILDSETKEVLLDNSKIVGSKVGYGTNQTGATNVYLGIQFNKEGKQKLEEISRIYVQAQDEEGKTTTKKITMKIDDEELMSTYFGEPITTGELQLTIGNATSSSQMQQALIQGSNVAMLLDGGKLPIAYAMFDQKYITSAYDEQTMTILTYVCIGLALVSIVLFTIFYKRNGCFFAVLNIGYAALLMLVLRYTNVTISLLGVLGIILSIILNMLLYIAILRQWKTKNDKEEKIHKLKELIKQSVHIAIPILLLALVACFANYMPMISLGMTLFWGIAILVIYNIVMVKAMFTINE